MFAYVEKDFLSHINKDTVLIKQEDVLILLIGGSYETV
jgi:hypothetical protein